MRDRHPSLRRRIGTAAETAILWGTGIAIWFSVATVLIGGIVKLA